MWLCTTMLFAANLSRENGEPINLSSGSGCTIKVPVWNYLLHLLIFSVFWFHILTAYGSSTASKSSIACYQFNNFNNLSSGTCIMNNGSQHSWNFHVVLSGNLIQIFSFLWIYLQCQEPSWSQVLSCSSSSNTTASQPPQGFSSHLQLTVLEVIDFPLFYA